MNPKDGSAGSPVEPTAPVAAEEADVADPGEMAEIKKEQIERKKGKYGTEPVQPHKPPTAEESEKSEEEKVETTWIEIELVGEDDQPISGEKYKVILPDETVDQGTLDQNGWARIDGFTAGTCKISFPDLDQDAWEFIESAGAKQAKA